MAAELLHTAVSKWSMPVAQNLVLALATFICNDTSVALMLKSDARLCSLLQAISRSQNPQFNEACNFCLGALDVTEDL